MGRGGLGEKVGVRGGTQLIDFKNKALVYLYLDSLLPLRYGAFYMQPGGLVPRARGRIYRLPPLPPTSQKVGWGRLLEALADLGCSLLAFSCIWDALGSAGQPK